MKQCPNNARLTCGSREIKTAKVLTGADFKDRRTRQMGRSISALHSVIGQGGRDEKVMSLQTIFSLFC